MAEIELLAENRGTLPVVERQALFLYCARHWLRCAGRELFSSQEIAGHLDVAVSLALRHQPSALSAVIQQHPMPRPRFPERPLPFAPHDHWEPVRLEKVEEGYLERRRLFVRMTSAGQHVADCVEAHLWQDDCIDPNARDWLQAYGPAIVRQIQSLIQPSTALLPVQPALVQRAWASWPAPGA